MDTRAADQPHADFLATIDLFSTFTRVDIDRIAESAQSRFFAFGDTVCNAGEMADGLFVVKSGSIRVFAEEDGKEVSLGVRKAGDVLAEMVMLRDYRHEVSARASAKTELLFIPRSCVVAHHGGQPRGACVRHQPRRDQFRRRTDQPSVRPARQGRQERARGARSAASA